MSGVDGLPERCAVLKCEPPASNRLSQLAPFLFVALRAFVSLVYKKKIVPFERRNIDADPFAFLFRCELGDLNHSHLVVTGEQRVASIDEEGARDAALLHFLNMLGRQALVWREQNDVVETGGIVFQELKVIDVHQERLAAPRCHPESELVQLFKCKVRPIDVCCPAVLRIHKEVYLR